MDNRDDVLARCDALMEDAQKEEAELAKFESRADKVKTMLLKIQETLGTQLEEEQ